ncbi:Pyruvoyl-dependent arginine decarboxylase AaxB [Anaerohalosphaera lusitana]|uniref:Pyruvoyl-dependent arginine decarboxylase AaxB n=2 Tax=Anaerohalosphaera lusitana TaxID=1936003 RepID=A0A1U9NJM9_9BACT|nr:Pyruvoyl-dependent arginine decarboxylase AaxB [Anaerohalosphaera lusitana]
MQDYGGLNGVLVGNRIPKDYFVTEGTGQSDITVHAGSYHLALRNAGIEMCNIMCYSSILPKIARQIDKPAELTHGSVMETISAVATADRGQRATAGIIYGWLRRKDDGEKHGGLVCEYNGHKAEADACAELRSSLKELYTNGYSDDFDMDEIVLHSTSFVPEKRYGTALIALCFVNYVVPMLGNTQGL